MYTWFKSCIKLLKNSNCLQYLKKIKTCKIFPQNVNTQVAFVYVFTNKYPYFCRKKLLRLSKYYIYNSKKFQGVWTVRTVLFWILDDTNRRKNKSCEIRLEIFSLKNDRIRREKQKLRSSFENIFVKKHNFLQTL